MSTLNEITRPYSLAGAGLFHCFKGRHPLAKPIQKGMERVELVTGGRGWVDHEGGWLEVGAGTLLWHIEGEMTISRSDFEDPYRCLALHFKVSTPRGKRCAPRISYWKDFEAIDRFSREILDWYADVNFDRHALFDYAFGRILFQVRLWERIGHLQQLPDKLQTVVQTIESRLSEPLLLDDIARKVGWSVAHLHEVFRKHLNVSPHQMILQQRLRLARSRLASTDDPIKQIAGECGFSTVAAFCRTFHARTGMTPRRYRQHVCQVSGVQTARSPKIKPGWNSA